VVLLPPRPRLVEGIDVSFPHIPLLTTLPIFFLYTIVSTSNYLLALPLTATPAFLTLLSEKIQPGQGPKHKLPLPIVSQQPVRPNTSLHYTVYTKHYLPMPGGPLNQQGSRRQTSQYPEPLVIDAILGICRFGARIRYQGRRDGIHIHPNLSSAADSPEVVTANIAEEREKNRLECYPTLATVPESFTASPLGLVDKSNDSKRRIHHLSYPAHDLSFVNAGIPQQYGTIAYSSVTQAILAIQKFGTGCLMVKRNFECAFRHIPISPLDMPLLGFHWQDKFYSERFLVFGLRTAPYLFNLFAEVFHWILLQELTTQGLPVEIVHYLDNFLIILPPNQKLETYSRGFTGLSWEVGLAIKISKNQEGTVAEFGGVELDTNQMEIRLPTKKLQKARTIAQTASMTTSFSLLELQTITGYLNFVCIVVHLGRAFLRRLYNMELYFPNISRHYRRRVSAEAHKDLTWWAQVLKGVPVRSIREEMRDIVCLWSDASGTKGLGAYYTSPITTPPGNDKQHGTTI